MHLRCQAFPKWLKRDDNFANSRSSAGIKTIYLEGLHVEGVLKRLALSYAFDELELSADGDANARFFIQFYQLASILVS